VLVAQPMSLAPPLKTRPVWEGGHHCRIPQAKRIRLNLGGGASRAGELAAVKGSELIWVTPGCAGLRRHGQRRRRHIAPRSAGRGNPPRRCAGDDAASECPVRTLDSMYELMT